MSKKIQSAKAHKSITPDWAQSLIAKYSGSSARSSKSLYTDRGFDRLISDLKNLPTSLSFTKTKRERDH